MRGSIEQPGGLPADIACETFLPPIELGANESSISEVKILDVDADGDSDVLRTRPGMPTFKLAWLENLGNGFSTGIRVHPLGENDRGLVGFAVEETTLISPSGCSTDLLAEAPDIVAFSQEGSSVHWFRRPTDPVLDAPVDPSDHCFAWEVYDIVHDRAASALDIGDLDGDDLLDVVVAFGNSIRWYKAHDDDLRGEWDEFFVHDDDDAAASIRSLTIVDVDADGNQDLVATVDRTSTDNDALIWFRNAGQ